MEGLCLFFFLGSFFYLGFDFRFYLGSFFCFGFDFRFLFFSFRSFFLFRCYFGSCFLGCFGFHFFHFSIGLWLGRCLGFLCLGFLCLGFFSFGLCLGSFRVFRCFFLQRFNFLVIQFLFQSRQFFDVA